MLQEQNGSLEKKTRDFQHILRRERAQHGWSQADVAQKIGSDPKTVGRWERGLTFPNPYMCQRLSELYGKSIQELRLVRDEALLAPDVKAEPVQAPTPATADLQAEQEYEQHPLPVAEKELQAVPPSAEKVQPTAFPVRRRSQQVFLYLSLLIIVLLLLAIAVHWPPQIFASPPSATPTPSNPYTSKGKLVLNEPLTANSAAGWSLTQNDQGQCFFADGKYRIRDVQVGFMEVCLANETYATNFTYEATMTIVAGDCGGLAFRTTFPQLYYFLACLDGRYRFVRYDKDNSANVRTIDEGISPAIHQGLHTSNVLAVVAIDKTFQIYVNHTLVVHNTDGAYLDGQIGFIAHTCRMVYPGLRPNLCDAPTEVAFNNARMWKE